MTSCRVLILLCGFCGSAAMAAVPHVNWENHPVHPLDLSPDGRMLAVAHTADARVQLFDVSTGTAIAIGHVLVGLDPVSVRFRTNDEIWVVNHISDSISIVDVPLRQVRTTVLTADEPFDVVFAGAPQRAWVSSSQTNQIQRFSVTNPAAQPVNIPISGEDPRSLAASPDGQTIYAAIFESGNGSTVLSGATNDGASPPNAVNLPESPYGGQNPPPNNGNGFSPPLNGALPPAPRVAHIVRKSSDNRWLDDEQKDWTPFVSGSSASQSGRIPGWDLPDRDIAVIDTSSLAVDYVSRLMTMAMAISVNPGSGEIVLVGTEASNERRFEPNVNGIFAQVRMAVVDPSNLSSAWSDLNPHLDYSQSSTTASQRMLSVGDPRGIAWNSDGSRGYVAGMGSNNVVVINRSGRLMDQAPIDAGEGPVGIVVSADDSLLYVWNHFEASLSVINLSRAEEQMRSASFNPLPEAIRIGRRHLYNTLETSGLGHLSCASCHVDARTDRLAWDLGDPSGEVKDFNQNCSTALGAPCRDFHPMKGPMLTQTLQDIIGNEPLHWRGDRDGLEEFNPAFESLMGSDQLSTSEMQQFKDFLATVTLPPNPFRNLDNSLSTEVDLGDLTTTDRFGSAGRLLGTGDAANGLLRFTNGQLSEVPGGQVHCTNCHSLPTGMGVNGTVFDPFQGVPIGGTVFAAGPNGENHLSVASLSTNQGITMKVPHLRTLYERTGLDLRSDQGRSGFGFLHDGTVGTLADFLSLPDFVLQSDQDVANLAAFLLSFSGSDLPTNNLSFSVPSPSSLDSHAAIGQQETLDGGTPNRLNTFLTLARAEVVDLIATQAGADRNLGWRFDAAQDRFVPDNNSAALSTQSLQNQASASRPVTVTVVPSGLAGRLGIDRDGDGIPNGVEWEQGSDSSDDQSTTFGPIAGLWYNPTRSGHGVDLQRAGNLLAGTWYTYEDDNSPTWYQAVGPFSEDSWSADLNRFVLNPDTGSVELETVGTMSFQFSGAREAEFCWSLGTRSACEPFQRFAFAVELPLGDHTGLWFDPLESGYGFSVDSQGDVRVMVTYFYDAENQPRWVLGQGSNAAENTFDMLSFTGFCPDCAHTPADSQPGGVVSASFDLHSRSLTVSMNVNYPGLVDSTWERSDVALIPLTDKPIDLGR